MSKRKIILLLALLSVLALKPASAMNYEDAWKNVDKLEDEGKTRDALEAVKLILAGAQQEKNDPQTVKAQLYKYKYMMRLEEESEWKIVQEIRANIGSANGAEKAILQSILAQLYHQYYESNSWKFAERTKTAEKPGADFRTWDLQTLFEEIRKHYLASLDNPAMLQQMKLDGLKDILSEEKNSQRLRPTLYDLLAHRAIDFFASAGADLTQPANAFALSDKAYFSTAADFVKLDIQTEDTTSNAYLALQVFRELLRFRLNNNNIDALADADLKRVQYVHEHFQTPEAGESAYFDALLRLRTEYVKCPMGATVSYVLAEYTYRKAFEKSMDVRFTMNDALKICNETIKQYPSSDGAKNCEALKLLIFTQELSLTTEKHLVPNAPAKALVQFRNIDKIYLKWVPVDYKSRDKIFELKSKETQADVIKRLNAKKQLKQWTQTLPKGTDYLPHSAEIKLEGLTPGYYVLLASTNAEFSISTGAAAVAVTSLFVSPISYTVRENNSTLFEIYVLDRKSGLPLENASVRLYHREYDYDARKYKNVEYGTVTTDATGYAAKKIEPDKGDHYNGRYYNLEITHGGNFLPSEQSLYAYDYRTTEPEEQWQLHLFTDRAIYRPGQTIYFKGILVKTTGDDHSLLANKKVELSLHDVNDQEVRSETFTTGEFGSFSGSFTAPATGLLGAMSLQSAYGTQDIRVEEYKRPKFEVTFDTVKMAYNLNDTVSVSGKAIAYSGATLDNATVTYKVMRTPRFPVWCWWGWRKPWFPPTPARMIATGTTTTDANGNFTIDFTALPDLSVSKDLKPYFDYEIVADVTDINGETQSNTTRVRVGYLAIEAEMSVADRLDKSQVNTIGVKTNNLNGAPEPTNVTIKIYDLQEPQFPKRGRLWAEPDTFVMSKAEHDALFPYDNYDDEDLPVNWKKGTLLNTYSFNTGTQTEISLPANSLTSGAYLIEFSCKDKNGNAIEFKKSVIAYADDDTQLLPKQFATLQLNKNSLQPGDTLTYTLGTSMAAAYFVVEVMHRDTLIEKQNVTISNGMQRFSIPVNESYRGGIELRYSVVSENRQYSGYEFISVPFPDDQLKVSWATFRDKLLPGQKETWKLTIKGPKQDKVTAELLAAMYDASLDAFVPHGYSFYLPGKSYNGYLAGFYGIDGFGARMSDLYASKGWNPYKNTVAQGYDDLNLFGLSLGGWYRYKNYGMMSAPMMMESVMVKSKSEKKSSNKEEALMAAETVADGAGAMDKAEEAVEVTTAEPPMPEKPKLPVSPRTNLNETAFFFPQLQTDDSGNVVLNFTMPEALTKWNFLGLAHTKDLQYAYFTKSVQTQKDLMVVPNAPRFLREGDQFEFTAKISNLSASALNGLAELTLYDAATMQPIAMYAGPGAGQKNTDMLRDFSVEAGRNTVVSWSLQVPDGIEAIYYKVVAQAGDFSDGEAAALPVLPNRMLVTESMPLWISGKTTKNYTFDKLLNNTSKSLKNYAYTLEMSSNPVWYAVQALPYMMEYPYECAEQLFSRYYANALASHIANANPRLKQVFDLWKNSQALLSNLEKNQELKNVLLEETPWVREAQDESEQKKRIALLFDLNKMANEKENALNKLAQMQTPNGGYTWFPGMPDNRYITAYIVAGMGHLDKLNVINISKEPTLKDAMPQAVKYLDNRMREAYEEMKKYDKDYQKNNHLYYDVIYYLYARSFFPEVALDQKNKEAFDYYLGQSKKYWLQNGLYAQGLIALVLQRNNDAATAGKIIESLRQNAIRSEELGMYWKANEKAGWYWYEAPVETQALLIEAFTEVAKDEAAVDELKVWLLKQKQTTSWKSTKATAEACYALLLGGTDWVGSTSMVEVKLNKVPVDPKAMNVSVEPGTGYYKVRWEGEQVKPEMAKIQLKKNDKGPAWGAVYWQYFEDLDKITGANTSLQLTKTYYKKVSTPKGEELQLITDKDPIKVGDLITVRIELRTDRNLEYVHLKDLRAAGMEPTNVLSQYKYQDNLGYYESTRDVATHFFMDWMGKGIYVFEYTLRASLAGDFSSGITQIECMYAPEFKAHSKGQRQQITK